MTKVVRAVKQTGKEKNDENDAVIKKDHKNAHSSHQQECRPGGKIGLFGKSISRQHAHQELIDDAFDLMDAQDGARFSK